MISIGNNNGWVGPVTVVDIVSKGASDESDIKVAVTVIRIKIIEVKRSIGASNGLLNTRGKKRIS